MFDFSRAVTVDIVVVVFFKSNPYNLMRSYSKLHQIRTNLMLFWTAWDYFSKLSRPHLVRTKTTSVSPVLTASYGLSSTSVVIKEGKDNHLNWWSNWRLGNNHLCCSLKINGSKKDTWFHLARTHVPFLQQKVQGPKGIWLKVQLSE